jgi:hypothetical protein
MNIFKRRKAPPVKCECGKFQALVFFEGRALCFECHLHWLHLLELADQERERTVAQQQAGSPAMCECGEFQALVFVDGRRLCSICHDRWLIAHGLAGWLPGFSDVTSGARQFAGDETPAVKARRT